MARVCVGCSIVVCWDRRVGDEDVIDVLRYRGVEARAARAAGDYRDTFRGHFEYVLSDFWEMCMSWRILL